MARIETVVLIDDVDDSPAQETVAFALDGVEYTIDLSEANAAALRDAMGSWAVKARRVGGRKRRRTSPV